jgi:NDP-sugar pyrophosphorylase family protein
VDYRLNVCNGQAYGTLSPQATKASWSNRPSVASAAKLSTSYSRETTPLGTGGSLWKAPSHHRGERAVVVNSDTYIDPDFPAMIEHGTVIWVIAVVSVSDCARFGSVRLEGRQLVSLEEEGRSGPRLITLGNNWYAAIL